TEAYMELRETIWQGVRIELAAVAGVMLCALKFSPDTAARILLAYLVGVAAMTVVVVVTRRRGDHAVLGPHRGSRGVRVSLAAAGRCRWWSWSRARVASARAWVRIVAAVVCVSAGRWRRPRCCWSCWRWAWITRPTPGPWACAACGWGSAWAGC